jgi:hypothetical protein
MNKPIILILLLCAARAVAHANPITSITISLPANPDANVANWGEGTSPFSISATSAIKNGRVDPAVADAKFVVAIRRGATVVYGASSARVAPVVKITSANPMWRGKEAVALLGSDCTLPPGDYELSVQFYNAGAEKSVPLSDEQRKAFSIRGAATQNFAPPKLVAPSNGVAMDDADRSKPLMLRWTPVVPRPQEPTTYRLRVWQLMQGQTGTQAMRVNQPIITRDIDNLTQATVTSELSKPSKPPHLSSFVWIVQSLNREGKPIGGNNGTSEMAGFSYSPNTPTR